MFSPVRRVLCIVDKDVDISDKMLYSVLSSSKSPVGFPPHRALETDTKAVPQG